MWKDLQVITFMNSTFGTVLRLFLALIFGLGLIRLGSETQLQGAHWYLIALLTLVALFQMAVAFGFPLGEFTQGGQQIGRLDVKARKNAIAALPLIFLFALTTLDLGGVIQLQALVGQVFVYLFMAYLALGLILNSISRSIKESVVWTPVLLLNIYLMAILYFAN